MPDKPKPERKTADAADRKPIPPGTLVKRSYWTDAKTLATLNRIVAEVPGIDNLSAAYRWMTGPAERELDRLAAKRRKAGDYRPDELIV